MKIKKQLAGFIKFQTLILVIGIFCVLAVILTSNELQETRERAETLGKLAVAEFDADELYEYTQTGEPDEKFVNIYENLADLKSQFDDCVYLYAFCPHDENVTYLYNVYTEAERQEYEVTDVTSDLCDIEQWSNLGSAYDIYKTGEEMTKVDMEPFSQYGYLVSYYVPAYGSDGSVKVIVGVDFSLIDFIKFMAGLMGMVLLFIILISVIAAVYEAKAIDKAVVKPIEKIGEKTLKYARSNHMGKLEEYLLPVVANPVSELECLSVNINDMMEEIDHYIENIKTITAERQRIETELSVATAIQEGNLPKNFPSTPEFDLFASMTPAKEVGGDFYDFFMIDDDHLGIIMADVSGKGVPGAMFMMISKVLLENVGKTCLSPKETLEKVNNQLCDNNQAEMFVTVWYGILDLNTGVITAANAGHEFPAVRHNNGSWELFQDKHGFVLAGMSGVKYKEYEITLEKGDSLFLYTDGVAEATSAENELFGTDRMLEALNKDPGCDVRTRIANVKEGIDAFVKEAPQFDDITMLTVNFRGREA